MSILIHFIRRVRNSHKATLCCRARKVGLTRIRSPRLCACERRGALRAKGAAHPQDEHEERHKGSANNAADAAAVAAGRPAVLIWRSRRQRSAGWQRIGRVVRVRERRPDLMQARVGDHRQEVGGEGGRESGGRLRDQVAVPSWRLARGDENGLDSPTNWEIHVKPYLFSFSRGHKKSRGGNLASHIA